LHLFPAVFVGSGRHSGAKPTALSCVPVCTKQRCDTHVRQQGFLAEYPGMRSEAASCAAKQPVGV